MSSEWYKIGKHPATITGAGGSNLNTASSREVSYQEAKAIKLPALGNG